MEGREIGWDLYETERKGVSAATARRQNQNRPESRILKIGRNQPPGAWGLGFLASQIRFLEFYSATYLFIYFFAVRESGSGERERERER